jgi:hypothetical protein
MIVWKDVLFFVDNIPFYYQAGSEVVLALWDVCHQQQGYRQHSYRRERCKSVSPRQIKDLLHLRLSAYVPVIRF